MMREHPVWTERYRPQTIEDCILPKSLKKQLTEIINGGKMPNLIFTGTAGTGKTTAAKAIARELGMDFIVINGSMDAGIDTLRNDIRQFASTVSMTGSRKLVILDEGDMLSHAVQGALRNFMEEYSSNCSFIITCNFINRIIEPLHSRCSTVHFQIPKEEKDKVSAMFFKRVIEILDKEEIAYEKPAIAALIKKHYPDWRRVLNELQKYSMSGTIDAGVLSTLNEESFETLLKYMKAKKYTEVRRWIGENQDQDSSKIYRAIYDRASTLLEPASIPAVIIIIGKYQAYEASVADHEINMAACFAELMVSMVFKD